MDRFETKASFAIGEAGEITGIAWPFGTPDRVGDVIEKGAFAGSLGKPVTMLFGHDPMQPIGAWTSLEETSDGLVVKGRLLVDTVARAREVHSLIEVGALTGLSIGFNDTKAVARKSAGRLIGRTISGLTLHEISLVTIPCHPGARITGAKNAATALALADAINRAAARFSS